MDAASVALSGEARAGCNVNGWGRPPAAVHDTLAELDDVGAQAGR